MCSNFTLRGARLLALCVASAFAATATAQVADPAKLFSREAEYVEPRLSPTGDFVAVSTPDGEGRALSLIRLTGTPERNLFRLYGNVDRWNNRVVKEPYSHRWSDDGRIVVFEGHDYGRYGTKFSSGNVFAADADAKNQQLLFGYVNDKGNFRARFKDEGTPQLMRFIPDSKGEALFYFWPWTTGNSQTITSVYRVDLHDGTRTQIENFPDLVGVGADNAGVPRVNVRHDLQGNQVVQYRPTPTSPWMPMPASLAGRDFGLWMFDRDNNIAYAEISDAGEPAALYRVDLSKGTRERIGGQPNQEITGMQRAGRLGPPVILTYAAGKPKVDYIDPASSWTKLHAGLMKAFPGEMVEFLDVTKDESKLLFATYSDRNPGAFYLLDLKTNAPSLLFKAREWIDPSQMSPTLPIEFKTRDGETLFGFLTLPKGRQGPQPFVVMPHGGPFEVSDDWSFDNDSQFLASLGYAVLRVNYRGSGWRGRKFTESAYKQWGTRIQDDIADGVKHVIAQGLVDGRRACIYGASFGGYSAMMNPIRNPGMYKCAIGYVGVYDLNELYKDKDYSRQMRSYFSRTMGDSMAQASQSPLPQVGKLDVPILLIHGKSDYTAPYEQFRLAESALATAGKTYETLVKADEGHGFRKPANQEEAYNRMKAFLLKYNPPN